MLWCAISAFLPINVSIVSFVETTCGFGLLPQKTPLLMPLYQANFTSKSAAGVRLSLFSQLSISAFIGGLKSSEAIYIRPSSVTSDEPCIFQGRTNLETLCPTLGLYQSSTPCYPFPYARQSYSRLCVSLRKGRKLRRFHASDPSCPPAITPAHLPFVASGVQPPPLCAG